MADLEIDDDVRERFAYLFKPVTDFAKNFEIDIIELLQEYDNRTLSTDTGFNFVNAAAMLQGTTGVYGRRVDILHKAVTTFKAEFTKEPINAKKKAQKDGDDQEGYGGERNKDDDEEADENGDDDKEVHAVDKNKKSRLNRSMEDDRSFHSSRSRIQSQEVPLDRPTGVKVNKPDRLGHRLMKAILHDNGMIERADDDGFCIFERFHVAKNGHSPIHISREREYQLMFIMPGSMMPLLTSEKRPVELLGNYGKFGDVDDYRMCRDLVVHNYALYSNPGGTFCYPPANKVDPCQAINTKIRDFLQTAHSQNLLPMSCAGDVEATLQNNFQNGRASFDLVEICRRVSDGQATTDFIHRLSHCLTLNQNERRKTELQSHIIPTSQEPPVTLDDDYGPDNDFSFAGISFNSILPNDEVIVRDSLAPPSGPVTRSRQAQNSSAEPRRSARLAEQSAGDAGNELAANDEFELLDEYAEEQFKYKPFMAKKRKVNVQAVIRRRENQIERELKSEGKLYLPSLQRFLDNYFWIKSGKKKTKKHTFELTLARQLCREANRRKAIKSELRKQHMEGIRQRKPIRSQLILPEVGKRAKKSMEVLQQQIAESIHDVPEDNDNDNGGDYDFDNDFDDVDAAADDGHATPPPLGDIMPDHPAGIDLDDMSKLSLGRKRSTMVNQPLISQPNNVSFGHQDHDFDMGDGNFGSQPAEDYIPYNASISSIVQIFLSRKWNVAVQRQPECQERLVKWERKMIPVLEELKDDFLAHDYGKIALDKFDGEIGRRLLFSEIIEGRVKDKSRFFLALLMLTNRGTVIIYPPPLDLDKENSEYVRIDDNVPMDFEIELLDDTDWQGNEMNATGLFT